MALALFSSAFSPLSRRTSPDSSLLVPERLPSSTCAWPPRTSATIRTARSFNSTGYRFLVSPGMTPTFPTIGVSGHPGAVQHDDAVLAMREHGIDISGRRSKNLSEFAHQRFDHVISLCDRVREVCPDFPGPPIVAHWSMPDPAAHADGGRAAFARTADELTIRIEFLLYAIQHTSTSPQRT